MNTKRVVFHVPSLIGGGAERVWVLMANELARRGHEVTLFTWSGQGANAGLVSQQVRVVDLGLEVRNEGFGKLGQLRGLWHSTQFLRREQPDAVFSAPDFANLIIALALLGSGSKARFFPSFHAAASLPSDRLGTRISGLLSGLTRRRATRVIAVSAGVGKDLERRGVAPEDIAVINNPLPPHFAGLVPVASRQGEVPVIVTAGRLTGVKDHRALIEAFARLRQKRPARLVIFGEGPMRPELEAMVAARQLGGEVSLPGYLSDPVGCYAAADLFVLSSQSEGFGNVLIEAMASGVPVVSTDCEHGPREILADGAFGTLVPVGDAAALADAMSDMLDHPMPAERLQRRAADFTVERIGDRYEALLA